MGIHNFYLRREAPAWSPNHLCREPWPQSFLDAMTQLNPPYMEHFTGENILSPDGALFNWDRDGDLGKIAIPALIVRGRSPRRDAHPVNTAGAVEDVVHRLSNSVFVPCRSVMPTFQMHLKDLRVELDDVVGVVETSCTTVDASIPSEVIRSARMNCRSRSREVVMSRAITTAFRSVRFRRSSVWLCFLVFSF